MRKPYKIIVTFECGILYIDVTFKEGVMPDKVVLNAGKTVLVHKTMKNTKDKKLTHPVFYVTGNVKELRADAAHKFLSGRKAMNKQSPAKAPDSVPTPKIEQFFPLSIEKDGSVVYARKSDQTGVLASGAGIARDESNLNP